MILLFGGTTEGRKAAGLLEAEGRCYIYSTKRTVPAFSQATGTMRHGVLDDDALLDLIRSEGITTIIDAAHPFAEGLHWTIGRVAGRSGVPVIRIERFFSDPDGFDLNPNVCAVDDIDGALRVIRELCPRRLLALTGVQSISRLRPWWQNHSMKIRIHPSGYSVMGAEAEGFPLGDLIIMQPSGNQAEEETLIRAYGIDCVLTKESGNEGFLPVKISAAAACSVPVIVIRRPRLPAFAITLQSPQELPGYLV